MDSKKKHVVDLIIAGIGPKPKSKDIMSDDSGDESEVLGQELIDAVEAKDGMAVYDAFAALMEHCKSGGMSSSESEEEGTEDDEGY